MAEIVVDTKGLSCPLPILRLRKAMKDLAPGTAVRMLATDPGAVGDVQAFSAATGNTLLGWRDEDGVYTFDLRKAG